MEEEKHTREIWGIPIDKSTIISILCHAITTVLLICSVLNIYYTPMKAMVLVMCAHLPICFYMLTVFNQTKAIGPKIGTFIRCMAPSVAVTILASIFNSVFDKDFAYLFTSIAAVVFNIIIVFDLTYFTKAYDLIVGFKQLKYYMPVDKVIFFITTVVSRILFVFGAVFTVISGGVESVAVVGCLIWLFGKIFSIRAWNKYYENIGSQELDSDDEFDATSASTSAPGGDGAISENQVLRIAKGIADRWSGKNDPIGMLSGSESVRYKVSVDVFSDTINYTVGCRLEGVRDGNENAARTYAQSKLQNAASQILSETQSALSNQNLPHAYNINVNPGYIE